LYCKLSLQYSDNVSNKGKSIGQKKYQEQFNWKNDLFALSISLQYLQEKEEKITDTGNVLSDKIVLSADNTIEEGILQIPSHNRINLRMIHGGGFLSWHHCGNICRRMSI
jgi:hypothetical protein